jgi:MoxR-like ATPase
VNKSVVEDIKMNKKHRHTEIVDSMYEIKKDLVQFAEYAISGDASGARVYGMRRVRELMTCDAPLAHALRHALTQTQAPKAEARAPLVRDAVPRWQQGTEDNGVELLRVVSHPELPLKPEYADSVRASLQSIVIEHQIPERLQRLGLTPTRTVLLSGPPGVGKTLAATWIARQLGKPLLLLDLGTVMSRYLGATGANLKRAIAYALSTPGVLFLDELDALAKRRDDAADVGELKRLVTVLLQELDEWPAGRLLVAATNHPQLLDDAVWRRFEARVEFPRPDATELKALMTSMAPPEARLPVVWTETLPAMLAGTSHSDFVRALTQLRKSAVTEPDVPPSLILARVLRDRLSALSRKEAKSIALALAKDGALSLRQIAQLTRVSRDTLRRAGVQGG